MGNPGEGGTGRLAYARRIRRQSTSDCGPSISRRAGCPAAGGRDARSPWDARSPTGRRTASRSRPCIFAALFDGAPPELVGRVPADGALQRFCEIGRPAEAEVIELRGGDRVAAVVAGAVGDAARRRVVRLAQLVEDDLGDLAVGALVAAADVVDLAGLAVLEQRSLDAAAWSSTCSQSRTFRPSP